MGLVPSEYDDIDNDIGFTFESTIPSTGRQVNIYRDGHLVYAKIIFKTPSALTAGQSILVGKLDNTPPKTALYAPAMLSSPPYGCVGTGQISASSFNYTFNASASVAANVTIIINGVYYVD